MMKKYQSKYATSRERLHRIIDIIDEDKIDAILTLLENIDGRFEYPEELKSQLNEDFEAYISGEKTYSEEEIKKNNEVLINTMKKEK